MYNRGAIFTGFGILAVLGTFPLWWLLVNGGGGAPPELTLPQGTAGCVESGEFMRRSHMDLLDSWRDSVVRVGQRVYTASDGREIPISLTGTCLGCHGTRQEFCSRCHEYTGVAPSCWDCHLDVEGRMQ